MNDVLLKVKSLSVVFYGRILGVQKENITMQEGDLLILEKPPGEQGLDLKGLTRGRNDRTGEEGLFPTILVYVLNTLCKPSEDICVSPDVF